MGFRQYLTEAMAVYEGLLDQIEQTIQHGMEGTWEIQNHAWHYGIRGASTGQVVMLGENVRTHGDLFLVRFTCVNFHPDVRQYDIKSGNKYIKIFITLSGSFPGMRAKEPDEQLPKPQPWYLEPSLPTYYRGHIQPGGYRTVTTPYDGLLAVREMIDDFYKRYRNDDGDNDDVTPTPTAPSGKLVPA